MPITKFIPFFYLLSKLNYVGARKHWQVFIVKAIRINHPKISPFHFQISLPCYIFCLFRAHRTVSIDWQQKQTPTTKIRLNNDDRLQSMNFMVAWFQPETEFYFSLLQDAYFSMPMGKCFLSIADDILVQLCTSRANNRHSCPNGYIFICCLSFKYYSFGEPFHIYQVN